ncbi:Nif11 family protein [Xylophilus sp. Leaf220]|uniref:Nif11 family protein n=1 Tax=Xylophilus sp. Leaf220 TaxID=1735686 RepID=UPI0006F6E96C|nr:Nif11 family protein [Xylophilus sp. Leaf220]KQM70233.1 hypothetical protein ASE76_10550 [Xylophilus sp. Leaf220]
MSQAHIEEFYSKVSSDPAQINELLNGASGPDEFIDRAVAKAKSQGYDISRPEAEAWINKQKEVAASGELSDVQLEAVAGGKSSGAKAGAKIDSAVGTVSGGINYAGDKFKDFFSGW